MQKTIFKTRLVTEFQLKADYDANGPWETLGELRWVDNLCYRWIKNLEASTDFTANTVVCHDLSLASDAIEQGALIPVTADLGYMAGVPMSAIPFGGCGWIQVSGYNVSVSALNASGTTYAIGDYMKAANTLTTLTVDAATQPLYKRNIQILEAVATVTTTLIAAAAYKCLINCLD